MSALNNTTEQDAENLHARYLQTMGIQMWQRRHQVSSVAEVNEVPRELEPSVLHGQSAEVAQQQNEAVDVFDSLVDVNTMDWPALQTAALSCAACALHESRTKVVFDTGDHQAQVMVIGEAPNAEEDQQGEPFVGPAGELLNKMLLAMGFQRGQVYLTNSLNCRPPDDRDPQTDELMQCEPFLKRQIELVKPKVILAVGRIAAHHLLKEDTPIGKMRGKPYYYGDIPVIVTYHPAYLLRKPSEKAKSWDDLRLAMSILNKVDNNIATETVTEGTL